MKPSADLDDSSNYSMRVNLNIALRIVAGKASVSTAVGYGLVGSKVSVNTQKQLGSLPALGRAKSC